MSDCHFCGDMVVGGAVVTKHEGEWVNTSPVDPEAVQICKGCAMVKGLGVV